MNLNHINAADHYAAEFGDYPDYDRWAEIKYLVAKCDTMAQVEDLLDQDEISYGELHSIEVSL